MTNITTFSDGGARGNPGPAAIGFTIFNDQDKIHAHGEYVGETTNNVAEYRAIAAALHWLVDADIHPATVTCKLDSQLVVNQIKGVFKIKQSHLLPLFEEIGGYIQALKKQGCSTVTFLHIPREQNQEADRLVNKALDETLILSKNQ